jgi:RHS repeat-associated protein
MQNYTQQYSYDELGNMLQMQSVGNWTRDYVYNNPMTNNYLLRHGSGTVYTYDAHGNMLTMPHLTTMNWDYLDQLHSASNGTFTSYYNYDSEGNRTRKVVVKNNIIETRYYINGYELYRKEINGVVDFERKTINISDDEKVFVRIEQKTGENPVVRYQYDNHLGSACLELDNTGQIISYEEYHPFGTTSYRSGRSQTEVSLKRYKYCGKERDEETGLYYYGMRYYAAWICRFVSVDPLQFKYPYYTPYQYAGNKPITYIDLDGGEEKNPYETLPIGFKSGKGTETNPIQLSEVRIVASKTEEKKEFEKYPNVGESTGWSILNPEHKENYQIGKASGLIGMLILSQMNFDVVYLIGNILNKIKNDPAIINYEKSIITKAKSDERFGKEDYSFSGTKIIVFGGERWTSKDENWFSLNRKNPLLHKSTWKVASNELTWALRHAKVNYFATVSKEGKINIEYKLNDVFDLTPSGGRSEAYNTVTKISGFLYHDILGGNRNLQIRAEWKTEKSL